MRRSLRLAFGGMLALVGTVTLGLNTAGALAPAGEARGTLSPGLAPNYMLGTVSATEVEEFFSSAPAVADFAYVRAATDIIFKAQVHGPQPMRATENWLMWLASKAYPFAGYSQDPDRIIAAGGGLCNDAATALQGMLRRVGIDSRLARLGQSHIVLEVLTATGWVTADADWGLAIAVELTELVGHVDDIGTALVEVGWPPETVGVYLDIVEVDHIDRLAVDERLGETLWLFERTAWMAKWPLAFASFASGLLVLHRPRRRPVETRLPVAVREPAVVA